MSPPSPCSPACRALAVGVIALVIRLLHLAASRDDPSFAHPVLDGKTYHDLATGLAGGQWSEKFLWQAPFYPVFLAGVYKVLGVTVVGAKIVQAFVGAATCALTSEIGDRLGGRAVGWSAGLIAAAWGPLVFFELQPLATGWAAFWTALIALLLVVARQNPRPAALVGLGFVLALAHYTRPTFIVTWLVVVPALTGVRPRSRGAGLRRVGLAALGFAALVVPATIVFTTTTGHAGFVPASGGINLHLGNNPDYASTINIRPGLAWAELVAEPARHGYAPNPWDGDRYFRDRVRSFVREHPAAFLRGLGEKALTALSSREMPRNLDVYLHRTWSPVLAVLVWRAGPWGFPFGLAAPLVALGLLRRTEAAGPALKALLLVLVAATVLVFVSARYLAVLAPLFAVFAALGGADLAARWRSGARRALAGPAVVMATVAVLATWPGPFPQEGVDLRAELEFNVGRDLYDQERWAAAVPHLERSVALDPDVHAARQVLGICLARLGEHDRAVAEFEAALALRPGHAATAANLAQARRDRARTLFLAGRELEADDPVAALAAYRAARRDAPDWFRPPAREALILATSPRDELRDGQRAVELARAALKAGGVGDPYLLYVLAVAQAEAGRWGSAREAADRALAAAGTAGADSSLVREITAAHAAIAAARPVRRGVGPAPTRR